MTRSNMKQRLLLTSFAVSLVFSVAVGSCMVSAANQVNDSGDIASSIYTTPKPLQPGVVVMVNPKDSSGVLAATQDKLDDAFGVVKSTNNLPVQPTLTSSQAYVVTSGRHEVLVTDENGPIAAGDLLAVSSMSGTLMRVKAEQSLVFAKALSNFDSSSNVIGDYLLKDVDGNAIKKVKISKIPASIAIMSNPDIKTGNTLALPSFLQQTSRAVADKPVSNIRVYFGAAIILLSVLIAVVILASGIRGSMVAIGRNPMSRKIISRGLTRVLFIAVIVLFIGLFTVYLLLRL